MAFFWKPIPCWSGFFVCSVYCYYTINKLEERHLETCNCVGYATAARKLFILTPSGRLATEAALLPQLFSCLLFKDNLYLSSALPPAEKDPEPLLSYNPPPQSCSPLIPLAWWKLTPNWKLSSKCFFGFPLQLCDWVSIFNNLCIHPSASPLENDNAGRKWRRDGDGRKDRKNVPEKHICYYWVRNTASKKLWLAVLSDIILLINKGKGPHTHLPTGKVFNYSQDYRYHEFNMQTYSPDFAHVHGSVLTEISILLHFSTVIAQHLCGNVICSGKLEADASRKSNEWLPSVWKLPILIWAILTYHSVDVASSVSLVEHLPKIGVLWCFEKC